MNETPMSQTADPQSPSSIWGGRFASGPAAVMQEINASIGFDKRLYRQDIAGSKAHAAMLAACGIISEADANAITSGWTRFWPRSRREPSPSASPMKTFT